MLLLSVLVRQHLEAVSENMLLEYIYINKQRNAYKTVLHCFLWVQLLGPFVDFSWLLSAIMSQLGSLILRLSVLVLSLSCNSPIL